MSFLPFVLSFLLILVLGSSLLFNSFRSTSLEKTVILGTRNAKLDLISEQHKSSLRSQEKTGIKKPKEAKQIEKAAKGKAYKDRRNRRNNLHTSKLNLWPLFNEKDMELFNIVYESTIKLIENLYKKEDFYKEGLAKRIVDEMSKKKGEALSELFPEDKELAAVYYKMLKGTNTGYPSLEEYLKIEKTDKPPVIWRYASAPVLEAVFGKETKDRILAQEKAFWEENHFKGFLNQENLRALLRNSHPDLEINKLETVFSFDMKLKKGMARAHVEKKSKVMATR